uniref:ABC transmembrane type-1 domain-containing protein n=1 Tax=Astyanax mexicanus TaxID=7994 RepID=A0A8B9RB37_ASTMX
LYANPVLFIVSWKAVDSGSLFLFWLLQIICEIFPFQTLLRDALNSGTVEDLPRFCLFYISYGLQLISLVLSAIADVPAHRKEVAKKNPEAGAAFLSRVTFNWFNWMVINGYRRPLVQEDMWELSEKDSTNFISREFEEMMKQELRKAHSRLQKKKMKMKMKKISRPEHQQNGLNKGISQDVLVLEETGEQKKKKKKEKKEKKSSSLYPDSWLVPTILKSFKGMLWESALFKLLQDLLAFASPQLLKVMISFAQNKDIHTWQGYLYAVLLLVVAILQSIFLQQYFQRCFVLGMKVRTAIMAAVYKKALVVSNDARKESTVGETVNLMSADAQRFNDVTNFIHLLWSCPLQIILSIVFLWMELGPSVLAGLLVMVLMVPINGLLATKSKTYQMENMKLKDKRMKIMNEILNGIKILKLYAWEPSFEAQVQDIREQELKVMRKFAYLSSVSTFIFSCAPALVSLATFAVFVSVSPDNILDAEKAFTSISLFNILRFPLAMLPMLISSMVQTVVSRKRLEKFLGGEDLDTNAVQNDSSYSKIYFFIVHSVNLEINPGHLVAVVGAVGSGKSSLISAMLGEMHNLSGSINIKGDVAYVPQQAWIQNATLKDNILFGSDPDERRFNRVVEACALKPDLELLPGGVQTEIGEKVRLNPVIILYCLSPHWMMMIMMRMMMVYLQGINLSFLVFVGTLLLADGAIHASRTLHSRLLSNILRVPMLFFDTTPSGRVVNRFAKDMFTVDEMIPMSFRSWVLCLLGVLGTLFVICLATPIFTAIIVPLAVVYYFVQRFYVATSRQLRRLDSVSRSPIYSHFGETVSGLSVIRAYGHQERFLQRNRTTIDENLKSVYPWIVSNRWLAIRLEFLGNLVVFFSALFAVISRDSLDSGLVGLSISYALNVRPRPFKYVTMNYGGQKQRVSLARAAFSSADIYLLDDPLSAVDSHVGKHLFEKVIGPRGLLKDKVRSSLHHLNYLLLTCLK